MTKKQAYVAHEEAYRSIRERGLKGWDDAAGKPEVDPAYRAFLEKALEDFQGSKPGVAVEFGCGSGPLLRWLHGQGWSGAGIDISRTAVAMAREQSKGMKLAFHEGDVTKAKSLKAGKADLVLDGHCLHCLIEDADRDAFFHNAFRLLRPGGLLVVNAMAGPLNRAVAREGKHVVRGNVVFAVLPGAKDVLHARNIGGEWYQPVRRLEHWESILKRLRKQGFNPLRFVVTTLEAGEFFCDLLAVARKGG